MLDLVKLVHLELFICLPPLTFLALIEQMPCLRYFKTDYDILLVKLVRKERNRSLIIRFRL